MDIESQRRAAIDIGTVTTRLLVADVSPGAVTELARSTDITHLGRDLTATGRLAPEAIERVRDVVAGYCLTIAELGVKAIQMVAGKRAGPDQTHLAANDIPQLWQLVEACAPHQ